jgi:inner membrane protein
MFSFAAREAAVSMKGTTHAAVGLAIGSAIALGWRMDFADGALCAAVSVFSALSADLDGQGMLTSKLGKTSRAIYRGLMVIGLLFAIRGMYQYFMNRVIDVAATATAAAVFVLCGALTVGFIRNVLVSLIGCAAAVVGWQCDAGWAAALGLFIAVAPWLKHRGFTHTIWCNLIWAAIGWGMERQIGIDGLALAASAGYFSHLAADTLTPGGVRWLYPIIKKTFRFPLASRRSR